VSKIVHTGSGILKILAVKGSSTSMGIVSHRYNILITAINKLLQCYYYFYYAL